MITNPNNQIYIENIPTQEIKIGDFKASPIDVEFNKTVYVRGSEYHGKYNVTPTIDGEILPTQDKTLDRNITIKGIPAMTGCHK